MRDKLKNIFNLSKLFIKENENNLKLINKENKLNKKSLLFWIYIILFFAISYLSSEIISFTVRIGKPQIFLNVWLLFLEVLIIIRTTMVNLNVFYFSKDLENILYLPLKPIEILIAKFNTVLFMNYELELIFGLIPLFIYGIYTNIRLISFINVLLVLIIFPVFIILIISVLMMIMMKIIKLFKNKDLMQIIISFILIFCIMFFLSKSFKYISNNEQYINENQELILNNINEKIIKINNYFLNINPVANIMQENNILEIISNYLKLIFINIIGFLIFIFLGNKLYLKQLLKTNFYFKNKKNKKTKLKKSTRKNKIGFSYIKKEFKLLFKNPLFFIQSVYPVILMTITISILLIALVPSFRLLIQQEQYKEIAESLRFNIEAVCIIVGIIQIVGLFNFSSITAFSREGNNAYIMKVLPISLHKQFIYKNIPQIFMNTICAGIILATINFQIPEIKSNYIFIIFILSFLLILINSFILVLIDLLLPKLEWDAEYDILKNNKNRLLQYILIFINILFLFYIKNVFENYKLNNSLIFFAIILIIIFSIINLIIFKYKNKLYEKIR